MPILAAEPTLFPDELLDSPEIWSEAGRWMVLHTRPRQEKSVARELLRQNIPFYLPLVKRHLHYGRRRMVSFVPVFGGYVFTHGADEHRLTSFATQRVLRVLPVGDEGQLLDDLRQVHRLIESGVPLTIEGRLNRGMRVRVRKGLLMGVEGEIICRRGETRLLVCVNFLQQGASVEIDDFCLEPLD